MLQSYVDTGNIAPLILFYSGPGGSGFNNIMINYYGTGYTPSFFCDGVWDKIGWNQSQSETTINSRLAEPAYVDIDVSVGGDATAGVVYYNITAEQNLQAGSLIRVLSVLVESDIYAASGWGVYTGKTLHWIPRIAPLGNAGKTLDFSGTYPETISLQGEFTIDPDWNYDNMGIVTFVMDYETKEVFNAHYESDLSSIMGIEEGESNIRLSVGPNPSAGNFSTICTLPDGQNCTVDVFDVTGRRVATSNTANSSFSVDRAGLYIVRLTTENGEMLTESVAVTR